jgi:hypothetical protein
MLSRDCDRHGVCWGDWDIRVEEGVLCSWRYSEFGSEINAEGMLREGSGEEDLDLHSDSLGRSE